MASTQQQSSSSNNKKQPALVFGASGEEGRAVLEGLIKAGRYEPVYAFTRHASPHDATVLYLRDGLGATLLSYNASYNNNTAVKGADLENVEHVHQALKDTQATAIFLVTTTELPTVIGQTSGCSDAAEAEFQVICNFCHELKKVHDEDGIARHLVLSTRDNVQKAVHSTKDDETTWIEPLDDGSIVPHYSAKGRGAEYAMEYFQNVDGIDLTLLTMPFFYSNFLGFFCPLPVDTGNSSSSSSSSNKIGSKTNKNNKKACTQWTLSACFGSGNKPIDMMAASDLSIMVPTIFANRQKYANQNLRLVAERISMNEISKQFSDLFGKDVIYNPLSFKEVSALPIPAAGPAAQMCLFLSDPRFLAHDLEATLELYHASGNTKKKSPTIFTDWLLTHSDSTAFTTTGLDLDAPVDILKVTVFGATTPEGISVVKGLLKDKRKHYTKIRMAITDPAAQDQSTDEKEAAVADLLAVVLQPTASDSKKEKAACLEVVHADLDDLQSCANAVKGMDGVFLVTDFFRQDNMMAKEEAHAKNVIEACSSDDAGASVQHLVFCTMESVEEMEREHVQLQNDAVETNDTHLSPSSSKEEKTSSEKSGPSSHEEQFHAKARIAALARKKQLSVTYVLLPCYSELFFDMIQGRQEEEKLVLQVPTDEETQVVCFSIDDLGPAVANIFDSYQVYAGHEIGLVTDFCTVSEVKEIIEEVFLQEKNATSSSTTSTIEIEHVQEENKSGAPAPAAQFKATDTYMKDLGQMFAYMARSDAVKRRHSIAKTMQLVPSARPLREWVEQNRENPAFREKLGLR